MRRRAQRKGFAEVDERELVVVQRTPAVRLDIGIVAVAITTDNSGVLFALLIAGRHSLAAG